MVPAWGHYNPSVPRNPCFAASQFLVAASDRLIAGTDPLSINGDHMTSLCLQPHHKKRILEQMDTNGTCRNWTGREFMNSMKQLQHLCILVLQYLVNPHVQFVTWCCLSKHARKSPHIISQIHNLVKMDIWSSDGTDTSSDRPLELPTYAIQWEFFGPITCRNLGGSANGLMRHTPVDDAKENDQQSLQWIKPIGKVDLVQLVDD